MLDFFRSDTPLTDRVLSDQHSDLTACALAGAECVLEAYAYRAGRSTISSSCCRSWPCV